MRSRRTRRFHIQKYRPVKPATDERNTASIVEFISTLPWALIIGSGCKLDKMRGMIKMKNGTVTPAMMEYTAASVARFVSSSTAERSEKYAPYINSKMKIEVSRGSQFQNEPQLNFAHKEPVTVARMQNINPNPADAVDLISSSRFFLTRNLIPYPIATMNATTVVHDIGTWKNRSRAFCSRPGIRGNSYQCSGCGTIGKESPNMITIASQRPRKNFIDVPRPIRNLVGHFDNSYVKIRNYGERTKRDPPHCFNYNYVLVSAKSVQSSPSAVNPSK